MKVCVIVPTIRRFEHWEQYRRNFSKNGWKSTDIIVVDEEEGKVRNYNREVIGEDAEFYGRAEREQWFRDRGLVDEVIPIRSHAETSFGLLVSYERFYDMVLFIDDDTHPKKRDDFLGLHADGLYSEVGRVNCALVHRRWANVTRGFYYPRGFPYDCRIGGDLFFGEVAGDCVLHQGIWTNVPDMNAVDILAKGGLDGIIYKNLGAVVIEDVPLGVYTTVCSMNLSFKPEIIPAFYQLYQGRVRDFFVNRFDDIWSGVFLKRIIDHLGKKMSFGPPVCVHDKYPRDIFRDIRAELEGMVINEVLWKVVDEIELTEKDYLGCYRELAEGLQKRNDRFHMPRYIDFLAGKMLEWVKLIEKLK